MNHDAQAPSCTEIGWDAYQTCSRCDYTTYVEKAALGHDLEHHEAQTPTCTEIGWDAYDTCSRCDYTTYVEKAALGHDLIDHEAKAPSCTEFGWNAYQTCSRCDYTSYEEAAALGHDYVNHEAQAPSCTEIGWDAYQTCSRCDYSTYQEAAALGHAWDDGVITIRPTEEQEGELTYSCIRCNAVRTETLPIVILPCDGENCPGHIFTDMPAPGSWAHNAIDWAYVYGITTGTTATKFSPNRTCNRGQIMTFIWRAAGCPEPTSTENPFTDVRSSDYFYKAVLWAVEQEITYGTSFTTFSPYKVCSRAQTVTFLWRAAGRPESLQTECPFQDVGETAWYRDAVLWAVENQITKGLLDDAFVPNNACTRAQVVTFLYRYVTDRTN